MSTSNVEMVPTSDLDFDPDNPRFYRLNSHHTVAEVIDEMLADESVQDLMLSIGQKGYFAGEPLLIVKNADGRYIVVEGNRRLAAVKLLNGELLPPARRKISVNEIRNEAIEAPPTELPCLIYQERRDVLRYLGYRHITGIKEWDSLSKARYLAELRGEFYDGLAPADQMRSLAKDIGSRSDYVAQLLTALSLYVHAEDAKFYGLPIDAKDIEFSYLTTALNYKKICNWLGLDGKSDIDMKNVNGDNLKKAFAWMFAKDQQGRTILGESRNLDQMAAVVASEEATLVLEQNGKLSEAFLYTDGPEAALQQAFDLALERVRVIWNMLPKTSPLNANHLAQADTLFEDVKDVRTYLRNKLEA